jgi:hypothetical protein
VACQDEQEHHVEMNKMTHPKTTDSDYFKFEMPFVVSNKSLHTAGAGLNKFDHQGTKMYFFRDRQNNLQQVLTQTDHYL